jgi:hypothetical protein
MNQRDLAISSPSGYGAIWDELPAPLVGHRPERQISPGAGRASQAGGKGVFAEAPISVGERVVPRRAVSRNWVGWGRTVNETVSGIRLRIVRRCG